MNVKKSQEAFGGFGTSAGHSHTFSSLRRNDIAGGGEKLSQYLRFTVSGFIYVGNGIRTLTEKTTQPPTNNYYSQLVECSSVSVNCAHYYI